MNEYIKTTLLYKLSRYHELYGANSYISIFKLIFFLIRCLFYIPQKWKKAPLSNGKNLNSVPGSIVFKISGGLGDHLVAANYIYAFKQKFGIAPENIIIYSGKSFRDYIFMGITKNIFNESDPSIDSPALYIEIIRFPRVITSNFDISIYHNDIELKQWIENQLLFEEQNRKYFEYAPFCDGESANLCINLGKKRINQPDITNDLGLEEKYLYKGIPVNTTILDEYGLSGKEFITIHRGVDTDQVKDSIKLWPLSYYNDLIKRLKEIFPGIKIVQLGVSHARCETMDEIDINLIEKTSLPDLGGLLQNARLHIDCEGGLVHFRHALLGGKSIVIFGPTSPDFFGYSENINIRSSTCPIPCEWLVKNWQDECLRKADKRICMRNLHPDIVISELMKNLDSENYTIAYD